MFGLFLIIKFSFVFDGYERLLADTEYFQHL